MKEVILRYFRQNGASSDHFLFVSCWSNTPLDSRLIDPNHPHDLKFHANQHDVISLARRRVVVRTPMNDKANNIIYSVCASSQHTGKPAPRCDRPPRPCLTHKCLPTYIIYGRVQMHIDSWNCQQKGSQSSSCKAFTLTAKREQHVAG